MNPSTLSCGGTRLTLAAREEEEDSCSIGRVTCSRRLPARPDPDSTSRSDLRSAPVSIAVTSELERRRRGPGTKG